MAKILMTRTGSVRELVDENEHGRERATPPLQSIEEEEEEVWLEKETGREMFTRIAELRVNNILAKIATLGKMSSSKSKYDYDDEDIERIRVTLIEAIEETVSRLRRNPPPKAGFRLNREVNKVLKPI